MATPSKLVLTAAAAAAAAHGSPLHDGPAWSDAYRLLKILEDSVITINAASAQVPTAVIHSPSSPPCLHPLRPPPSHELASEIPEGGGGGSSSADIAGESSRANGLEHQPFVKANLDVGSNGDDTHAAVDTNSNSPAPDITHAAATATAVGNSRINLNQARAEDGCTPLFAACCAVDAQQIVQALVDHGAAETWAPNHHGETLLTVACSSDNVGC